MILEHRNLYQSCKYTVLDSNYYAIPDSLWFSFPKQSKTMVHLLKFFGRGYINAGKYASPIERFGYALGCEIPPPPKKVITSAFFNFLVENPGKSWFWDYPQKDPSLKKDIPEWIFPWFFPHPWGTTQFAPPAANEAYSAACLFEGPQGWGMGMIGQFVSASSQNKSRELPHGLNTWIFEWSLYSLNMFERKILAFHLGCSLS